MKIIQNIGFTKFSSKIHNFW